MLNQLQRYIKAEERKQEWEGKREDIGMIEKRIKMVEGYKPPDVEARSFRAMFESAEQMYKRIAGAAAGRDPDERAAKAAEKMVKQHEKEIGHLQGIKATLEAQLKEIAGRKPLEVTVVGAR